MDTPIYTSPAGERTLAVIGRLTRVSGFMGVRQKVYSLILTDRRLIFAELSKDRIAAPTGQARDQAKDNGKGLWGQWGAQRRALGGYDEIYWQLTPDEALAESPSNFAVDRADIKKVKFKTGMVDDERSTPDQVTIKTTTDKYKLTVNGSLSSAKEAFRAAGIA